MNRERRKRLAVIRAQLDGLQEQIMELRDEEAAAFDNMPESLKDSERARAAEQSVDDVNGALEATAEAIQFLDSIEGVEDLAANQSAFSSAPHHTGASHE